MTRVTEWPAGGRDFRFVVASEIKRHDLRRCEAISNENQWGFPVVFREASKGEIPSPFLVFSDYPLPNSTKFHGIVRALFELGFLVGFHGDLTD